MRELGLAFLRGAGVRGLANVEFKRDERDGRLKLIECNYRFTAPNEQFRRAGMDLALFVVQPAGRPPGTARRRLPRRRAGCGIRARTSAPSSSCAAAAS